MDTSLQFLVGAGIVHQCANIIYDFQGANNLQCLTFNRNQATNRRWSIGWIEENEISLSH